MKGSARYLNQFFGVVRDGRAWDADYPNSESTDSWYVHNSGHLHGNGKQDSEPAGGIKEGQIISMVADLDKGTLRFWLDGQPHGPGWSSGVKGKLRWSVCMYYEGSAVQIVPTPELQPCAHMMMKTKPKTKPNRTSSHDLPSVKAW